MTIQGSYRFYENRENRVEPIFDNNSVRPLFALVITAVPVSFILLPTLWAGPIFARRMAREQGFLDN